MQQSAKKIDVMTDESALERMSLETHGHYVSFASDPDDLSPNQKAICALLVNTIGEYSQGIAYYLFLNSVLMTVVAVVTIAFVLGAISATYWIFRWIFGDCPTWILYLFPLTILFVTWATNDVGKDSRIELAASDGKLEGLQLGRLHSIFSYLGLAMVMFSLSGLFVSNAMLLFLTSPHGGVQFDGYFSSSVLITIDNMCRGVFLDVFELYELRAGGIQYDYTLFAGSVLVLYRLAFDVYVIAAGIIFYRRWRMNQIFKDYPFSWKVDGISPSQRRQLLVDWIESLARNEKRWYRSFADEFVFMMICEEYIRGDFVLVRRLGEQFPRLKIDDDVRALFVDDKGHGLL